jgi:ATP-binding cassette, subfamily F, member 3
LIQIRDLHYSIGERRLLDGVEWMIHTGRHMALVGPNGAGKTTLLRIIHGDLKPDAGGLMMPKGTRIGYLPQEETPAERGPLLATVLRSQTELHRIETEMRSIHDALSGGADPAGPAGGSGAGSGTASGTASSEADGRLRRLAHLEHRFSVLDGYGVEHRARAILTGLGFDPEGLDRPLTEFSGGWRMRAVLAGLLLSDPDILLLDEPTNHLDLPSLEWLEQYLRSFRGSVVVVSHDRFFIDRLATEIHELEKGRLTHYTGNYRDYEKARAEALELQRKRWKEQQDELERQQVFIDRFRYKATKAAQVQSRLKQLEKVERVEAPEEARTWSFQIRSGKPSYRDVLSAEDVSFRYGEDWVLEGVGLSLTRGEKVAVVGENGAGKTTLTRLIRGELKPQAGRVTLGGNVTIGMYSQHQVDALDLEKTVIEEAGAASAEAIPQRIRNVLGIFHFTGDDVRKKVGILSGGEKARVSLAKLLLSEANFLIMDEPTNHLDMLSKEALERALQAYDGTLLLISHDRYFLTKLVSRVFEVRNRSVRVYEGNYGDYLDQKAAEAAAGEAAVMDGGASGPSRRGSGPDAGDDAAPVTAGRKSREQRRAEAESRDALNRVKKPFEMKVRGLEKRIGEAESGKKELESRMADPETYGGGSLIGQLQKDHASVERELRDLYDAWEAAQRELEDAIRRAAGAEPSA